MVTLYIPSLITSLTEPTIGPLGVVPTPDPPERGPRPLSEHGCAVARGRPPQADGVAGRGPDGVHEGDLEGVLVDDGVVGENVLWADTFLYLLIHINQQIYLRIFFKVFFLNLVDRLGTHLSAELPQLVDHA